MSRSAAEAHAPRDQRALIAVDLGAESCRVSLLRWRDGVPQIELVHRFPNGPQLRNGGLRWPLGAIETGVDAGLRLCAALAPDGVRSIAVDGWAVDYVRVDEQGRPIDEPFCYRDERTLAAEPEVHARISPERLRSITGVQLLRINTLYQLAADRSMKLAKGRRWLNLPEYMLTRWGARPCSEFTNASHTQMVDLATGQWSAEIFRALDFDQRAAPEIVSPGTSLGRMTGELAELPAFRSTELIAPACHDTSSAIAGIPTTRGDDWGYISLGTWSLVGTVLNGPRNDGAAAAENFTNLGGAGGTICFHKNVNGMWILKQCMNDWSTAGSGWEIGELVLAAERAPRPLTAELLDVDAADLMLVGHMPERINAQRRSRGLAPLDESAAGASVLASLIFHSLAARYAEVLAKVQAVTEKRLARVYAVGGGSNNGMLLRLTAEAAGIPVLRGPVESATHGNFAVQLARLDQCGKEQGDLSAGSVARWASALHDAEFGA